MKVDTPCTLINEEKITTDSFNTLYVIYLGLLGKFYEFYLFINVDFF